MKENIPITPQEEALSFSKYYHMDFTPVPEYKKALITGDPCAVSEALPIVERNKLFEPGYLPVESGFCVMDDGTGFMANLTPMPGVTEEMFDWWFAWHGWGPLRYTVWNPYDHFSAVSLNFAHAHNESLSWKERYWNTTHLVKEDIGPAVEDIFINFRQPKEFGYEEEKIGTPLCSTLVCGNAGSTTSPNGVVVMTHFLRPVEGGSELRTRFWMGWQMVAGRPVKMIPDGVSIPLEVVRATFDHNVREFNHLATILPKIYEDEHDRF